MVLIASFIISLASISAGTLPGPDTAPMYKSYCSCPTIDCGNYSTFSCSTTCTSPQIAKCMCGSCRRDGYVATFNSCVCGY